MNFKYKEYIPSILCFLSALMLTLLLIARCSSSTSDPSYLNTGELKTINLIEESIPVLPMEKGSLFDDVLDLSWYAPYIEQAYEHGFVAGTGDNNFSPEKELSYGEFAVMLSASYLGTELTEEKFLYSGNDWASPYIATLEAVFKEIDSAYTQTLKSLEANSGLSRYQASELVAMLLSAKDLTPMTAEEYSQYTQDFQDIADYPYQHLLGITTQRSIMKGRTAQVFAGQDSLTRAEACVIVSGLLAVEELQQDLYDPERKAVKILEVDSFTLPVIMYHSVKPDIELYLGNAFILSPEEFRSDLEYLTERGYTGIFMSELIDYVYNGGDLPEKPILLTFDDGYDDNYSQVFPLLEEYRMKAVICLIGSLTEHQYPDTLLPSDYSSSEENMLQISHTSNNQDQWNLLHLDDRTLSLELLEEQEVAVEENLGKEGFLKKQEIQEMAESGWIEFQCHTYDMHFADDRNGSLRLSGESLESYQALLREDLEKNRAIFSNLGLEAATTFSYPGGKVNSENRSIIQELFVASFLTLPVKDNIITRDNYSCLHDLTRPNRDHGYSSEYFFSRNL